MTTQPPLTNPSDFVASQPSVQAEDPKPQAAGRPQLPRFLTLRSGSQQPERVVQNMSLEDMKSTAARQIRTTGGSTKHIAVYQLVFVEVYDPSSKTLTPDQFDEVVRETNVIDQELRNGGI